MNKIRKIIREEVERQLSGSVDPETKKILDKLTKKDNQLFDFYYQGDYGQVHKIKGKIIYVRFGLPSKDESGKWKSSSRHVFGEPVESEDGISVYEAGYDGNIIAVFSPSSIASTSFDELINSSRKAYVVDGKIENGATGNDGEPLIIPNTFKVITEIPKDIIVMAS